MKRLLITVFTCSFVASNITLCMHSKDWKQLQKQKVLAEKQQREEMFLQRLQNAGIHINTTPAHKAGNTNTEKRNKSMIRKKK